MKKPTEQMKPHKPPAPFCMVRRLTLGAKETRVSVRRKGAEIGIISETGFRTFMSYFQGPCKGTSSAFAKSYGSPDRRQIGVIDLDRLPLCTSQERKAWKAFLKSYPWIDISLPKQRIPEKKPQEKQGRQTTLQQI